MTSTEINVGTILVTGVSASGKTTLGRCLFENLKATGIKNIKLLDGEETRIILEKQGFRFGYSLEDRNAHAQEIAYLALDYNSKGFNCVVCTIAPVKKSRENMRRTIGNMMEVYLDCPVDICAKRDYKGNYQRAFEGFYETFIGVTDPYEISDHPDLVLQTGILNADECSKILLEAAKSFLNFGHSSKSPLKGI